MPCQPAEINTGQLLIGFNGTDTASMTTPAPCPTVRPTGAAPIFVYRVVLMTAKLGWIPIRR